LSFHVGAGEVYGLLGPNGAGKTTTLRMLAGLMHPTAGDLSIDGCSGSSDPMALKRPRGIPHHQHGHLCAPDSARNAGLFRTAFAMFRRISLSNTSTA